MKYVLVFTKGVGPLLRLASDFLARAALPSNNRRANTPALKRGPLLGADRRPLGNCPRRQPDSCESAFLSINPLPTIRRPRSLMWKAGGAASKDGRPDFGGQTA